MSNRFYSEFPERKIPASSRASEPKRGGKSASGAVKDTDPGYKLNGPARKSGLNRATKFPDVKIAVAESYDGNGRDATRYSR